MNRSVLITDDNYLCVEGIQQSIPWESFGITEILTAYDGETALEMIRQHHVDIVISDISMPGMTGLELSEQITATDSSVKIILISAYDKFEYARQAVRLGAFDYIEKPLDYDYLCEILKKALAEIDQERMNLEILKNSLPALEEQFYRSLIQSTTRELSQTYSMYMEYLNLPSDCSCFAALHISTEDASLLKQKLGIQEYHVRFMNLENYIQNLCQTFAMHYVLKDLDGFICIIGEKNISHADFKKKLLTEFSTLSEHFGERFELVIGLGEIVNSIWDLALSYKQALKSLEYRFFFPSQNILEANKISGYDSSLIIGAEAKEEELIQLICQNNASGIQSWIHNFTELFSGNYGSKNIVYTRLYSILARILKFCYEMNISTDTIEKEVTSAFSDAEKFKTINSISSWLDTLCSDVCALLQSSISSYHNSLCRAAVNYIEKNYTDSNLSLNEIAESVQLTPAYLSTLFKKYKDQNINNYITAVRIDSACQLLKNTALSLKVISTQVGYANQYYFSSCFKKKTGVTPSAYRETYQKQ